MIDGVVHGSQTWQKTVPVVFLLLVYCALTLVFLTDWPPAWPDESHFAEPSSVLARTGHLQSDLIPAFNRNVVWQAPGYFYFLSTVMGITGYGLPNLRSVSIATGALLSLMVYVLALGVSRKRVVALLALGLLVLNPNFTTYIKLIRMDGLSMLFQVAGVLLLLSSPHSRHRPLKIAAAGVALGAGLITHPLGSIGIVIGIWHTLHARDLSRRERSMQVAILTIPALLLVAGWLLFGVSDQAAFLEQMRSQLDRKTRLPWDAAAALAERYRSVPAFAIPLALSCAVWIRSKLWRRSEAHATVGAAAVIATVVVAFTFELQYHIYYIPWVTLFIALAAAEVYETGSKTWIRTFRLSLFAVCLNFLAYSIGIFAVLHLIPPVPEHAATVYARVEQHLPQGAHVLLQGYPDGYWFLGDKRPDLHLIGGVAFSSAERKALRDAATHVVIARAFDPHGDSVASFRDVRRLLGLGDTDRLGTVIAYEGSMRRFHPGAWIIDLRDEVNGTVSASDRRNAEP
jgi:4-amino-4-deoxy-L-arabinose transferase-like glycosyltransferase